MTGNLNCGNWFTYGGAGVYQGTLNNCTIPNNTVPVTVYYYSVRGGGAYRSVLNHCPIVSNTASMGGGAAFQG